MSAGAAGGAAATSADRHVVGTASKRATDEAKDRAASVSRVLDFGDVGSAVAGKFPEEALKGLEKRPDVRYVETDGRMQAIGESTPWGIDRTDADVVHADGETGSGTHVAIIDSGIDSDHPDLKANLGAGKAYVSCDGSNGNDCHEPWDDDNDHGTHCAGTVGAVDDTSDVIGMAPDVTLHAVKVLASDGYGSYSDIAAGITHVADQGWDVASMSLGGTSKSYTMEDACEYAASKGVLLVAAAGNSGPCSDCVLYPAAEPEVMAVSATDSADDLAYFSSTGPEVEIAAPGESVLSTVPGGTAYFSGTSMACPHVSGAGALLMADGKTAKEARDALCNDAENVGLDDNESGHGLLDAEAAIGTDSGSNDRTIAVEGTGETAYYEFEVSGGLSGDESTLSGEDDVNGSVATGAVGGGTDRYAFSGDLVRFAADAPVNVSIDGQQVDPRNVVSRHTLTIDGRDTAEIADYEFEVGSSLAKSTALGATTSGEDEVDGTVATGAVGNGMDSYTYTGSLVRFVTMPSTDVYLDGSVVDPAALVDTHTVTIEGVDDVAYYEFDVGSNLAKSTALGASISGEDDVIGSTATGAVASGGRDSFTYSGDLTGLATEGSLLVSLDGSVTKH